MRDDDARPEDQLPERPRSGGTLTDGRLPPEPVRPPRPPLPPERTTVSAPLITADDSAEGSMLFSDGDNADESDESDESDGSDFLEGETVAENLSLPMANDPTRVTMVPNLDDTGLAADKTVVAVVDFAALNRDRLTVPPTAHDDDDGDGDSEDEDGFDAPTTVSTDNVDATAGASFFERGTDAGEELPARGEPTAIAEITAPGGGPPARPMWFIGAVSFGVVSLLVVTVVVAYACSG